MYIFKIEKKKRNADAPFCPPFVVKIFFLKDFIYTIVYLTIRGLYVGSFIDFLDMVLMLFKLLYI